MKGTGSASPTGGSTASTGSNTRSETDDAEDVKHGVKKAKEEVKATAEELKADAEDRADRWTSNMAERATSVAKALQAAADTLEEEGEDSLAELAGEAAGQLERMSGYLADEDPSGMLDDLEGLGRRSPGTFLGGTYTLGLLAGRFLRASRPARSEDTNRTPDDSGVPSHRAPVKAPAGALPPGTTGTASAGAAASRSSRPGGGASA